MCHKIHGVQPRWNMAAIMVRAGSRLLVCRHSDKINQILLATSETGGSLDIILFNLYLLFIRGRLHFHGSCRRQQKWWKVICCYSSVCNCNSLTMDKKCKIWGETKNFRVSYDLSTCFVTNVRNTLYRMHWITRGRLWLRSVWARPPLVWRNRILITLQIQI